MRYVVFVLATAACGGSQHATTSVDGAIAGLARDHDSGEPIAKAAVHLRAQGQMTSTKVLTTKDGSFGIDHLAPGRYSLMAYFAGQQVAVENIEVRHGEPTVVDVTFTLGRPDPITVSFGNAKDSEIDRFKPPHHATDSVIEGTVNDMSTHNRVAGAVVTAVVGDNTLQAVSDDQGRYRFDPVRPGTYQVSAYYSISGHGQVEVRRSEIDVAPAEGVIVPLWVETTR